MNVINLVIAELCCRKRVMTESGRITAQFEKIQEFDANQMRNSRLWNDIRQKTNFKKTCNAGKPPKNNRHIQATNIFLKCSIKDNFQSESLQNQQEDTVRGINFFS